ncbi:tyrosine-protein phosphatase [Fictibacillus iocasae]|uniref:Tyrosine-protein phosphatase n=1 Tax=Fictibacillus iocasae TaxID=2715437 RepID=A0ABW2NPF2_9BACL
MIDIHCHILPGLDDGPASIADSIDMARAAANEGIDTIIATPHYNHRYQNDKRTILEKVHALNQTLTERSIPVTILPGQEPRLFGDMLRAYETEDLLTINNLHKYIFVELPHNEVPHYTKQMLYNIQIEGLIPVIVHPERNKAILKNPDKLYDFVKNGALTQVTAASYIGRLGRNVKSFSKKIVESNLAHFIASDAHDTKKRPFHLRRAYEQLEKDFGRTARYQFEENAYLLAEGRSIMKDVPEKVRQRSLLWFS